MTASRAWDFATLPRSTRVVLASFTKIERAGREPVWPGFLFSLDVRQHSRGPEYPVQFDFGGRRLCLSRDGGTVVVGCYEIYGLGAYDFATGAERWRRKDLKRVQFLRTLYDEDHMFCGRERGSGQILSCSTGETVLTLRGVTHLFTSSASPHVLLVGNRYELQSRLGSRLCRIEPLTFGVLDATFTPETLALSEAGGPLRAFDLGSGQLLWSYTPPSGSHFLRLAPDASGSLIAHLHQYEEKEERDSLVHFDTRSGEVLREVPISGREAGWFCLDGAAFLTPTLRLLSTQSGQLIYQY